MIANSCSHCGMMLPSREEIVRNRYRCAHCNQPFSGSVDDAAPRLEPLPRVLSLPTRIGERYVVEGEIARGGMGVILRAVDRDLRREVALKFLLDQSDGAKKIRFLEEA